MQIYNVIVPVATNICICEPKTAYERGGMTSIQLITSADDAQLARPLTTKHGSASQVLQLLSLCCVPASCFRTTAASVTSCSSRRSPGTCTCRLSSSVQNKFGRYMTVVNRRSCRVDRMSARCSQRFLT